MTGNDATAAPAQIEAPNTLVPTIPLVRQTETQIRVLFMLALCIGLTGSFYDSWKVAAGAVVAYGTLGAITTRNEPNIDRFADSLYYMGFLFTIWGLFFSFGPASGNLDNLSSKTIITQFGIKLITTVIALTFRIILTQFRSTTAEQTDEPEKALMLMVEQMTAEVKGAVTAFRDARDRILQEAQIGIGTIQSQALRNMESVQSSFMKNVERVLGEVGDSIDVLTDRLSHIDIPHDILTRRLAEATQGIVSDVSKLGNAIHSSSAAIAENLAASLTRVGQSSDHIDAALQALKGYEKLATQTQAMLGSAQSATDSHQEALQKTTRLLGELATVVSNLHRSTTEDVSKLREDMKATGSEIAAMGDRIRSDSERFSGALVQSVRILREEIDRR